MKPVCKLNFRKLSLTMLWMSLTGSNLVYSQTLITDTTAGEQISFSALNNPDAQKDASNNEIAYGPWGCKFTIQPLTADCGREEIKPPPPDVLKEQSEILNFLRGRKQALDERENIIMSREKELSELEKRVEQKINTVSKLNEQIESNRQLKAAEQTKTLMQLVKYYEQIPPETAAAIFESLDQQTATMILTRMNARKAAALMTNLTPEVAIRITEYIAQITSNREEYLKLPDYRADNQR